MKPGKPSLQITPLSIREDTIRRIDEVLSSKRRIVEIREQMEMAKSPFVFDYLSSNDPQKLRVLVYLMAESAEMLYRKLTMPSAATKEYVETELSKLQRRLEILSNQNHTFKITNRNLSDQSKSAEKVIGELKDLLDNRKDYRNRLIISLEKT